ncbi:glycosyltransferase [Halobaculum rarum]|uniref:glycosyltransferase n=1 Tax=Halobaculum rarum TaxID=3075122 RepID=UPI0032AF7595
MDIAQVTTAPPQAWETGGIARVAYELSKELVEQGNSVDILTTDAYNSDERYPLDSNPEVRAGIKIFRYPNISNYLASKYHLYASPSLVASFRRRIRNYDVVHCHDVISFHARPLLHYCNRYNIPCVVTLHGSLPWLHETGLMGKLSKRHIAIPVLDMADRILALNESEVRQAVELGIDEEKISIIPNGIDLGDIEDLPKEGQFKSKFDINESTDIILYVGRLHKSKGLDLLIDSFSELVESQPNSKLVFVGPDDRYKSELTEKIIDKGISEKVLFTGFIEEDMKYKAYTDSKCLITPNFDGFPMTFVESCLCGTPIITTNRGDTLGWIDGNTGYVTEWDQVQLVESMINIIRNDRKYDCFSNNCKQIVREKFNWESITSDTYEIYESLDRKK